MHATKIMCFVTLLFTSLYAHGQFSGAEMLQNCQQAERVLDSPQGVPSTANLQQAGRCFGFMTGLEEGIEIGVGVAGGPNAKSLFCVPPPVTYEQRLRVALLWLRNHPERLHERASLLIATAFRDAFPCGK